MQEQPHLPHCQLFEHSGTLRKQLSWMQSIAVRLGPLMNVQEVHSGFIDLLTVRASSWVCPKIGKAMRRYAKIGNPFGPFEVDGELGLGVA